VKKSRHPQFRRKRPKFFNSQEPVGLANELSDLLCDLPEEMRREFPSRVSDDARHFPSLRQIISSAKCVIGLFITVGVYPFGQQAWISFPCMTAPPFTT